MKSLKRLIPFLKPYLRQIAGGFTTFFIARFFEIGALFLVGKGIDVIGATIANEPTEYSIEQIATGIIGCVLGRMIVVIHARRAVRRASIAISYDIRQKLFASVQVQDSEFFGRMGVGDIMTRAIQDISLVHRLIAFGSFMFVIMVYAPLFAISFMLAKSVTLTLLILPFLPIIFVYAKHVAKQLATTSRDVQDRLSDLSSHTQENLGGIRTIQAQALEDVEIERFWNTNDQYAEAFYEQSRINSLMTAWMPWFASLAQLLIIVYGGHLVLEGVLSIGDLIFFLMCLSMLLQPIRMAGMFVTIVQRAAVATDRLYEIFDAVPGIQDEPSGKAPAMIRGHFQFKGLTYAYPGTETPAVHHIDLEIAAGESIGIVGRVGSGKSTLLKQFTRMVNTGRGMLLIDGHDVCDYPLAQVRSQISQVLQDPFLFGEPLKNNISYDDPDRALDLIWDSAEAAALKQTVSEFPLQMDTLVGERGVTLSGGQKQRATLARGLIRNAPVLILDDCFSSVDTETEEHILGRLKSMRGDKTTILVSHRVSTLRHSDRVVVLDEGEIVEVGSHEELMRKNGLYAELERAQTQGGLTPDSDVLTT